MKKFIIMMILSLVYVVVMDVANKKMSSISLQQQTSAQIDNSDSSYMQVKITGAVKNPGSYRVAKGETLGFLITLAGGIKENADESAYNVNAILTDNTTYYIACNTLNNEEKISINEGSVAQLDTLPGIGSVLAKRIVSYRSSVGKFQSLEDITKVSGIGDSLYQQIKDLICL